MNAELSIIEKAVHFVRPRMLDASAGHDWFHVERVWRSARIIASAERADLFVTQAAALFHDISDYKFNGGDVEAGPTIAREWLLDSGVAEGIAKEVASIIRDMSFKGAGVPETALTLNGQVVRDADRLDAIGAIGIARAFAYGGAAGQRLYDPDAAPRVHDSFESYKSGGGTTINHFFEKLLLIEQRLHTRTARQMASRRHAFMRAFLDEFFADVRVGTSEGP
jgi:uncharacterized protein